MVAPIIHKSSRSLVFPYDERINASIPKTKKLSHSGKDYSVVYFGEAEVLKLRELGYEDTPAPIEYLFEFRKFQNKHDVLPHQVETAAFETLYKRNFILNDMGTMKTASTMYAIEYMLQQGLIKKVLILAPLSCLTPVWADTIFTSFWDITSTVMHGTAEKRLAALNSDVQVYITNHDFVRVATKKTEVNGVPKYSLRPEYAKLKEFDLIVVDEASVFRTMSTSLWHGLNTILQEHHRLWLLTGTPTPNSPMDAYSLAKLAVPKSVPKFMSHFRQTCMMQLSGPFPKWVPLPNAHEVVHKTLQPAIRIKKEDCIDLPPLTFQTRSCELTAEQKQHFKTMKKEMVMEHDNATITAANAADRLGKIRQIFCGAIKADEADYVPLDAKPRIDIVLECIESCGQKAIVIVPYKGILKMLKEHVSKHYTCEIVNGDVGIHERNRIFKDFQESSDPHVLLCHPRVTSYGLTLTKANCMIFYAPIDSNDFYEQSCQRINRPGQQHPMTIVHICAHHLEQKIYDGLQERKNFQEIALDLYHQEIA